MTTPLARLIAEEIAADGPMSIARYMALALGHPEHGYYITRDPLGAAGDFTTAPEISQMFGEMLGLWAAHVWQAMGAPSRLILAELGPGRGTLMADALRAAAALEPFRAAIEVHLVETSPALRKRQSKMLEGTGKAITWHENFAEIPEAPTILIANEFFDALPIQQFEHRSGHWHERCVALDEDGNLALRLSPDPIAGSGAGSGLQDLSAHRSRAAEGDILELGPERNALAADISERLARHGGAALIIDYGHSAPGTGDTLQAVRAHRFADPLDAPGEADLTSHVDFAALARAASAGGARAIAPMEMGAFLIGLGMAARADGLKRGKLPDVAEAIDLAFTRLTDPGQMGSLFKVLALTASDLATPPPFT